MCIKKGTYTLFAYVFLIVTLGGGCTLWLSPAGDVAISSFRDCFRLTKNLNDTYECKAPDGRTFPVESDFAISSLFTGDPTLSGLEQPEDRVIESQEEFDALWAELFGEQSPQHIPPRPLPSAMNFDNIVVIALFAGEKPTREYSIEPLAALDYGDHVEVIVKETAPSGAAEKVKSRPYALFMISKPQKPITFTHITFAVQ